MTRIRSSAVRAQAVQRRIREVRRARKVRQRDLAERIGVWPQGMRNIERARCDLLLSRFLQICRALDVDPAELLDDQQPEGTPA